MAVDSIPAPIFFSRSLARTLQLRSLSLSLFFSPLLFREFFSVFSRGAFGRAVNLIGREVAPAPARPGRLLFCSKEQTAKLLCVPRRRQRGGRGRPWGSDSNSKASEAGVGGLEIRGYPRQAEAAGSSPTAGRPAPIGKYSRYACCTLSTAFL